MGMPFPFTSPRKPKVPPPSGVRSVSAETTLVMASKGRGITLGFSQEKKPVVDGIQLEILKHGDKI